MLALKMTLASIAEGMRKVKSEEGEEKNQSACWEEILDTNQPPLPPQRRRLRCLFGDLFECLKYSTPHDTCALPRGVMGFSITPPPPHPLSWKDSILGPNVYRIFVSRNP